MYLILYSTTVIIGSFRRLFPFRAFLRSKRYTICDETVMKFCIHVMQGFMLRLYIIIYLVEISYALICQILCNISKIFHMAAASIIEYAHKCVIGMRRRIRTRDLLRNRPFVLPLGYCSCGVGYA